MLKPIAKFDSACSAASQSPGSLARPSKARGGEVAYNRKFSDFLFLLRVSTEEVVVIHDPRALGDNYEELVESLNRLGDAGKKMMVVPRRERL